MSGYWALRALSSPDTLLRAAATFEAVSGDFETIFESAQPSFKNNYMYMAGYTDEADFDRDLKARMPLGDLVRHITHPVLLGIGEFDELTPGRERAGNLRTDHRPKEMRVYENEFHPLGGVAAEVFAFGAEWVMRALDGELDQPGRDERHFMRRDGAATEGCAAPQWWLSWRACRTIRSEVRDGRRRSCSHRRAAARRPQLHEVVKRCLRLVFVRHIGGHFLEAFIGGTRNPLPGKQPVS
jgi:hypothetical protein